MKQSLVVLPTYNEIENISLMIEAIFSTSKEVHILVVDDSSPDGTSDKVLQLKSNYQNRLFLLKRVKKRGLGTAYIDGFNWGLQKTYQYFFSKFLE